MKRLLSISGLVLITSLLTSCTRSNDDTNTINNAATAGKWKVSLYFDEKDETSDFAGYNFTFNTNGTATAEKSGSSVAGTWSTTGSKFVVDFSADDVLDELSNDWLIVEKTNTSIKLKDDNTTKNERLEFVKQ